MKTTTIFKALLCIVVLSFASCKAKQEVNQNVISGYYDYDTECVTVNMDGSVLVKSWGSGVDQKDGELNARRNAVNDILFKGVSNGNACNITALISNKNAQRDHKALLQEFYKKRGDFEDFVSKAKTDKVDKETLRKGKKAYEVLVSIDVNGLKSYFKNKQLIN